MKKTTMISGLLVVLLCPSTLFSYSIAQITNYRAEYPSISGDGTIISFYGQMNAGDNVGCKVINYPDFNVLVQTVSPCHASRMDYNGDVMIGGAGWAYLSQIDYQSGEIDQLRFPSTVSDDLLTQACSFPEICETGIKASLLASYEVQDPDTGESFVRNFTVVWDVIAGSSVLIDYMTFAQISGDCSKVVGINSYNGKLVLYNANGQIISDLGVRGSFPHLNHDGSKIAFICMQGGVCTINSDGTGLYRWTDFPFTDLFPFCSNGGDEIANYNIEMNANGDKILINSYQLQEIFILDLGDGAVVNLTDDFTKKAWGGTINGAGDAGVFLVWRSKPPIGYSDLFYFLLNEGVTPIGQDVAVSSLFGMTVRFDEILAAGRTDLRIDDQGPALLEGWTFGNWPPYYHLETTAGTTGQIEICISYDETDFGANEEFLHLGQYGDTAWTDITSAFDPIINNRICGRTDRLGDFAIAIGPTRWEPPDPYVPPAATGEKRKQLETLCGRIGSIFNLSGLALPVAAALIFRRRLVRSRRQP